MVRDIVTEAEGLLDKMIGGARAKAVNEELQSNMARIKDDLLRLGAGQSFATNVKNEWLEPGPGKVVQLMEKSMWDAARGRWKRPAVRRWLRQLRQFREALVMLTHLTGGQETPLSSETNTISSSQLKTRFTIEAHDIPNSAMTPGQNLRAKR